MSQDCNVIRKKRVRDHGQVAVIVGAGPAGLTAAYELLERTDVHPIVLEASDAIGGIAQTYEHNGNRIDIGGHRFFSKSKRVMDWWFDVLPLQGSPARDEKRKGIEVDYAAGGPDPELVDEVMLQRPRLSRIFYRRQFFPYPIGIDFATALRLGLVNTALIGLSYVKARLFPRRDEEYLDAFFINRFGKRLYETFFKDYTEKVWGVPCSEIKADWGAQRIKGLSLVRAVKQAVRDLVTSEEEKAREERETSLITRFFYPKYGPGQMWETVASRVTDRGGELRMRHRVLGVDVEDGRVVAARVRDEASGEEYSLACDWFFSSMPVRTLVAGTRPAPPPNVRDVADGLVYRDFLTVGLLLKKLHVTTKGAPPAERVPDTWIYVQEGDVRVGRVQVFNNWSPYMVADPDNTVWIGLEYFVDEGDDLWSMDDDDLVRFGTAEMEKVGFLRGEDVIDGCVLRMPKAYPAYFGTFDRMDEIQDWSRTIPNLFLVGRNGMHRYNNQDHSMLTAMVAVDGIEKETIGDVWGVNVEMAYHEEAGNCEDVAP